LELKTNFRLYLEKNYSQLKSISTIVSDAFYIERKNLGIGLNDILTGKKDLEDYRKVLINIFVKNKRKNPKSDASGYLSAIKKLIEYINQTKDITKYK